MGAITRREAILAGLAAVAAGRPAGAIEPISRPGKAHLKLSLAAYSFRAPGPQGQAEAGDDAGRLHRLRRRPGRSTPSN